MIAAAKPMSLIKPSMARPSLVMTKARRSVLVVRAEAEKAPEAAPMTNEDGPIMFAGQTFANEEEWKQAVANGTVATAQAVPITPTAAAAPALGFGDLMAFSGPAPEIINSRLSMIAVVAAIGAELSTGQSVIKQFACESPLILLTAVTFTIASLIPMFNGTKREPFGPFTPEAEITNGRAAMLGFASLLVFEAVKGSALF